MCNWSPRFHVMSSQLWWLDVVWVLWVSVCSLGFVSWVYSLWFYGFGFGLWELPWESYKYAYCTDIYYVDALNHIHILYCNSWHDTHNDTTDNHKIITDIIISGHIITQTLTSGNANPSASYMLIVKYELNLLYNICNSLHWSSSELNTKTSNPNDWIINLKY